VKVVPPPVGENDINEDTSESTYRLASSLSSLSSLCKMFGYAVRVDIKDKNTVPMVEQCLLRGEAPNKEGAGGMGFRLSKAEGLRRSLLRGEAPNNV